MRQETTLNRSNLPIRRGQSDPGPDSAKLKSDAATLKERVDDLDTQIGALQDDLAAQSSQIATNTADIAIHSAQIAAHGATLASHDSAIDALQASDSAQGTAITGLQTAVTALQNGTIRGSTRKITATDAVNATDYLILADAATGNIVVTLPALSAGRSIVVKKIDATINTVSVASDALIDGAASFEVTSQFVSLTVLFDGETWWTT